MSIAIGKRLAVVWKFAHLAHISKSAEIDGSAHLLLIPTLPCTHDGADWPQFEYRTNFTFPLVLHRAMRGVWQEPGCKGQTLATGPHAAVVAVRVTASTSQRPNRTTPIRITDFCWHPSLRNSCAHSRAIAATPKENQRSTETGTRVVS